MPVIGNPRVFQKKFAFVVEIEGVSSAKFTKCGPIEMEIAKVEQWEGGSLIPDKSPGRVTVTDVTLERGVANGDSDLYQWWLDVVRISANSGLTGAAYKRPVDILNLDRDGTLLRRWLLNNAWPMKLNAGDWDNEADENVIESLTLTYDAPDLFDSV